MNDENEVRDWHVQREWDPDISFRGKLLAEVDDCDGRPKEVRWVELRLYQTLGGTYICERRSFWTERGVVTARGRGAVCKDSVDVRHFLGVCPLAKRLYRLAGFDDSIHVP